MKKIEEMSIEELQAIVKAKKAEEASNAVNKLENMSVKVEGNKMTIVIEDITKVQGLSSSGKSHMIASTHGFIQVNGLSLGVNLTKKIAK